MSSNVTEILVGLDYGYEERHNEIFKNMTEEELVQLAKGALDRMEMGLMSLNETAETGKNRDLKPAIVDSNFRALELTSKILNRLAKSKHFTSETKDHKNENDKKHPEAQKQHKEQHQHTRDTEGNSRGNDREQNKNRDDARNNAHNHEDKNEKDE